MLISLLDGSHTEIDAEDLHLLDDWKIGLSSSRIYAFAYFGGMTAPLARIILGLDKGDPRKADHKDPCRTLDNRRQNLRIVNKFQSQWNTRKKCTNRSGHKGVCWHEKKQKWAVFITLEGKNKFLGYFPKEALDLAAATYENEARKHFGEYARV